MSTSKKNESVLLVFLQCTLNKNLSAERFCKHSTYYRGKNGEVNTGGEWHYWYEHNNNTRNILYQEPGTIHTVCDYTRELDPDQVGSIEFCRIRNLLPTYSFNIKAEIRFKNIKCLVARTRVEKEKKNMFEIYDILFVYVLGLYSIFLKYHGSAGLLL